MSGRAIWDEQTRTFKEREWAFEGQKRPEPYQGNYHNPPAAKILREIARGTQ